MVVLSITSLSAHALTYTWTGNSGTDWHTGGNWINGVPGSGGDVVITTAVNGVELSALTLDLNSLSISNNTLTCANWSTTIDAVNVTIRNNGKITVASDFLESAMSNRVHVVCTNLLIEENGVIDVDGLGFDRGSGPGKGGPNGTTGTIAGGAGYGGMGGASYNTSLRGFTYGSVSAPLDPGSGGGSHSTATYVANAGSGGGAIRVEARGTATIDGTLTVNGGKGLVSYGSGAAGGGIYVKCNAFAGSGLLRANGALTGYNAQCGAGGGGRIALDYQTLSGLPAPRLETSPGTVEYASPDPVNRFFYLAQGGTVWLADTALLSTTLTDDLFTDVRLFGPTSWSPASLTVSNCSVTFAENEFALVVAGDVLVGANGELGIGDYFTGTDIADSTGSNYALHRAGARGHRAPL